MNKPKKLINYKGEEIILNKVGSNSRGRYIKYPDGTMECTHTLDLSRVESSYVQATWNFPKKFIEPPEISGAVNFNDSANNPYLGCLGYWSKTKGLAYIRIYSVRHNEYPFNVGDKVRVDVKATGRWK